MSSTAPDAAKLLERLRITMHAAGIPATDRDFEEFIESGSLMYYGLFNQAVSQLSDDSLPDYLGAWMPTDPPPTASSASAATPSAAPSTTAQTSGTPTTIAAAAPLLRSRQISPVELTEAALQHIEQRDPTINAFQLVLADQALAAARQAEAEIAAGEYRGPLHGIPVAIKDLLAMQGTITTAGSKVLGERVTNFDSAAVERLTAAGAIIIGKTRLSEFAYSPGSTNAHYGPTRNPWNLEFDTGGSSSGSAASVAAGMVFGTLGSDTGGSIRIPASYCGVVGLKPTYGRISLYGCDPLSWSLDHLGPLTRTVEDAALILAALAGYDPRDIRTRPNSDFTLPPDLHSGVKGLRVGVLRDDGSAQAMANDDALAAFHAANAALAAQGAILVEIDLPEMELLRTVSSSLLAMEAAAIHAPMMAAHLDLYGPFPRARLVRAFMYDARDFIRAQQARQTVRRRWERIFEQVDVLSTPAQPHTAPKLSAPGSVTFTNPFNALGWPAISVPCGLDSNGLPLAIQLAGRPWDEATVLRAAQAVEVAQLMPPLPRA
jgi:aspartyl-tRNA(Asn)/glutamyl-tRNA(Gln) amidotransferase subunit A